MHYIPLGDTDLRVSRLCLGCMTFGEPDRGNHAWTLPEESSRPLIKYALEGGINFFDTSNNYSDGSSEEILLRAARICPTRFRDCRDQGLSSGGRSAAGTVAGADPAIY